VPTSHSCLAQRSCCRCPLREESALDSTAGRKCHVRYSRVQAAPIMVTGIYPMSVPVAASVLSSDVAESLRQRSGFKSFSPLNCNFAYLTKPVSTRKSRILDRDDDSMNPHAPSLHKKRLSGLKRTICDPERRGDPGRKKNCWRSCHSSGPSSWNICMRPCHWCLQV